MQNTEKRRLNSTAKSGDKTNAHAGQRIDVIDAAKGLAILLVVIGHLVAIRDEGPEGYAILKTWIYQFHMPFFMFLSGFTYDQYIQKYGAHSFIKTSAKLADRLLIPFLAVGVLIILIKITLQNYVSVDDEPENLESAITLMFFHTNSSPVLSIWYIWVLFWYSTFMLLVYKYSVKYIDLSILLGCALYFIPVTDNFYINRAFLFFVFFALGGALSRRYVQIIVLANIKTAVMLSAVFLTTSTISLVINENSRLTMMMVSIPAIPLLLLFAGCLVKRGKVSLVFLGRHTMPIYLMNTLAIGFVKIVFFKVFDDSYFVVYAICATMAGVGLPIFVKYFADRYTPGFGKYLK